VDNAPHIFEIHSLAQHNRGDPFIYIRKWILPPPTTRPRKASDKNYVTLQTGHFGFFEPVPYTYEALFPEGAAVHRVILQGDLKNLDGTGTTSDHPLRQMLKKTYFRYILLTSLSYRPTIPDTLFRPATCRIHVYPRLSLPPQYNLYTVQKLQQCTRRNALPYYFFLSGWGCHRSTLSTS
jgi:hypothetical protein